VTEKRSRYEDVNSEYYSVSDIAPNGNEPAFQELLIQHVFEKHARSNPNALAIVHPEKQLTYAELNGRANTLAKLLLASGIQPGHYVGICAERSVEAVIAYLGILKSGGAYVPLDPEYPNERLKFIVHDCAPKLILVQNRFKERFAGFGSCTLSLDEAVIAECSEDLDVSGLCSLSAAYVIYTSGSTGTPKGVVVEHRNVLGLTTNSTYATLTPDDCVAHCASPSFDATTWEVWGPLLNGARLLVVPQSILLHRAMLNHLLLHHAVTAMFLTVRLFNEYVDALEEAFGNLTYLLIGGEAVNASLVRHALSKPKPPRWLINAYGPTEATTFATTFRISKAAAEESNIPIGKPISNTYVLILNESGDVAPTDVIGEIYIGGSGVARGYLNGPALTAERFLPDRSNCMRSGRLYRTGDYARQRNDGQIEYVGRNDSQVKIRGYRVEPGEIEAQLMMHEHVRDAVVVPSNDSQGGKSLVAFVTLRNGCCVRIANLRAHLSNLLPSFMIPEAFAILEKLPLTPNGKVDRRALLERDIKPSASENFEPPQGQVEESLAKAWREVLNLKRVGRNDDFFELGANSIKIIKMIAAIEEKFGPVSVQDVFRNPTVKSLAQVIQTRLLNRIDSGNTDNSELDRFTF